MQGTGPYTWSITDGALPAGVSLSGSTGVVSGTPTEIGTFPFTLHVVDSLGHTASKGCSLTVIGGCGPDPLSDEKRFLLTIN